MALKRNETYPGRFSNPTTAHPQGAFKNRSAPGAQDGSYLEAAWANDWDGFFSSILSAAGVTPNGVVDGVGSSQYYNALRSVLNGRVVRIRFITAAETFVADANTTAVLVAGIGGGGGGGGCAANVASQASGGEGGGAGAFGIGYYTSGFNGATVTVGAPGTAGTAGGSPTPGSPNWGGDGGTSSFGSLLSLPGGHGGKAGGSSLLVSIGSSPSRNTGTVTGANLYSRYGDEGEIAILARSSNNTGSISGKGGMSPFGTAGGRISIQGSGLAATGRGAGGGGGLSVSEGSAQTGGAGTGGAFLVVELA